MVFQPRLLIPLVLWLLVPMIAFAVTGVPDMSQSSIRTRATQSVSIMICPACDGHVMFEAVPVGGGTVDATLEVELLDSSGSPIPNYPYEDIWLEGSGLVFCPGYGHPESNTDYNGHTYYRMSPCGGGCSEEPTLQGVVNGAYFHHGPIPYIRVNSPDMNGSLTVNLVDVSLFAAAFFGGYSYCADFNGDGRLDLVDVGYLAKHIGHVCPLEG